MEQEESNNSKTELLSEKEKKIALGSIIFYTASILVLIALIIEAYINHHPVFKFLQYDAFKSGMEITGSVSLSTMYIGVLLYLVVQCLLLFYDYQFKIIFLFLTLFSFLVLLFSFAFLFYSFNWQIKYSEYQYLSFLLIGIGVLGQMTKETISKINNIEIYDIFNKILKLPFYILTFVGLTIYVLTL